MNAVPNHRYVVIEISRGVLADAFVCGDVNFARSEAEKACQALRIDEDDVFILDVPATDGEVTIEWVGPRGGAHANANDG